MKISNFFIIFFLLVISSSASHLPKGQEITYKHVGGLQYEITYRLFMDCRSELAPYDSLRLILIQSSCFSSPSINLRLAPGYPIAVDENCYTALGQCNAAGILGATEYKFTGIVTLPGTCHDWLFSREECCVVIANTNVDDQSGILTHDFYSTAFLNNTIALANSSPQFARNPVYKTCIGEDVCINYEVYDLDNDSLVYELIPFTIGMSASLAYISGLSPTQPLSTVNPIQFDANTGSMCFKPINQETTYWNLRVSEFRNHILIGFSEREMMLSSVMCSNHTPTLSGLNSGNNFSATLIAGQSYCFTIQGIDSDAFDSTFISWSLLPSGVTINQIPGQNQSVNLCWTPSVQDIRSRPYKFILNVQDNYCPSYAVNSSEYELTVSLSLGNSDIDELNKSINVYPNPAKGEFKISSHNISLPCKLYLEDLSGRTLFEKTLFANEELVQPIISNGVYFVKIVNVDFKSVVKKLILTN